MKKKTRSILEELSLVGLVKDPDVLIDNRGTNLIESSINLLNLIKSEYSEDQAEELERRFINAIRTSDLRKFKRGIARIQKTRKGSV